jgi:hypothetical protein
MKFPYIFAIHNARIQELEARVEKLQHERDMAFESAERFALANIRLSGEVVRLSYRNVPDVPDGEVEQPTSTRESDREAAVILEDPQRRIRPQPPKLGRVE